MLLLSQRITTLSILYGLKVTRTATA